MDNHGKLWSVEDDQRLVDSPYISNVVFARTMKRTPNAIICRRNHLAAKMHRDDPATPLEEYVELMNADFAQASILLSEWDQKPPRVNGLLNNKRKLASPAIAQPLAPNWATASTDQRVETICRVISEEEGRLASVFNDPQFLPLLIQHYPGFEAYAHLVQAQRSLP